jgi:phosphoribosylamine---glycine ligase
MKCLVIGSGGREHALYWRLTTDGSCSECFVLPGNGGIKDEHRINISPADHAAVADFCRKQKIDLVVVGPEVPLVAGIVDDLEAQGFTVFGPSQKGAQLEGSKLFAKMIMEKYHIPTAGHYDFKGAEALTSFVQKNETYPIVIKLDGLAAGKGVAIPQSKAEALEFIAKYVGKDTPAFVEDFLDGEEASVLGISDGERVFPFVAAQDHKRVFDGDKGPNTGGMGAYAPAPVVDDALLEKVRIEVLQPVVDGMKKEGIIFKGILYAGLMVKGDSFKVLEFNTRFGDPEAQVILPLLDGKLGELLTHAAKGTLTKEMVRFKKKHAMTVVVASGGYPDSYEKGKVITGLDQVSADITVFHAGTAKKNGEIVSDGGRVLTVTALGDSLSSAKDKIYREINKIKFDGSFYRKDIGYRALQRGE